MLELSVFKEPRGVMRVLQFIFSICAFATTTGFSKTILLTCNTKNPVPILVEYPFLINITIDGFQSIQDYRSDAQFFVATGVMSLLLCIVTIILYTFLDDVYKKNDKVPMIDFGITVVIAVFWLSGSAAWANGLIGLKHSTNADSLLALTKCMVSQTISYTSLNISIIFGFLNFFLWASDLWFVYKETTLFQQRTGPITPNV